MNKYAANLVKAQAACLGLILIGPILEKTVDLGMEPINSFISYLFAGLFIVGLMTLTGSLLNLGRSLTPNPIPREEGVLVVSGLYSIVRHPIYTALILISIGWTGFWLSCTSLLSTLCLVMVLRKKADLEERLLLQKYGKSYELYMQKVNRFIPRWRY